MCYSMYYVLVISFFPQQKGDTALHYASRTGKSQAVEFLIERGANVNEENKVWDNTI